MWCEFCFLGRVTRVTAAAGWRLCCRAGGTENSHWEPACAEHGPAELMLAV